MKYCNYNKTGALMFAVVFFAFLFFYPNNAGATDLIQEIQAVATTSYSTPDLGYSHGGKLSSCTLFIQTIQADNHLDPKFRYGCEAVYDKLGSVDHINYRVEYGQPPDYFTKVYFDVPFFLWLSIAILMILGLIIIFRKRNVS
jgi:hypothetical protein